MACDPNQLLKAAKCFQCLSEKELQQVVTYLLCQISVNGSGGGGNAQLVIYTSGTPDNPPNTSNPAIAYDPTGNLPTLGWNIDTQSWN
jgi:hypothetical protein